MAFLTSRRLLGGALALCAALALTPSAWQAPWTPELAAVVMAPLRPATHGLAVLRDWLRPPYQPYPGLPPEAARLAEERDALQGELDRERIRSAALEQQLRELRVVVDADTRGGWRPVLATIVERPGGKRKGLAVLDTGTARGLEAGDPVVVGGNRLVGRVIEPLGKFRADMVPLDDGRTGRLDALVYPANKPAGSTKDAIMLQLQPDSPGLLSGEADKAAAVRPGDVVLLNDRTWKGAAQGMRLGTVERTGPLDSNPLRVRVDVRMDVETARLGAVTVKVADPDAPAGRRPSGGGS